MSRLQRLAVVALFALTTSACSLKTVALRAVADELSSGTGGSFSQDEDLEFVGDALPFGLKLMESINASVPDHVAMKLTLASGFTQYGVVFVEWPAEEAYRFSSYSDYKKGLSRAKGFYLRANRYAMTGLDLLHPGFSEALLADVDAAVATLGVDDVPLLFWAGASWLAAASTDLEDPEMFGLFPVASAMVMRAYALDPNFNRGTIPSILISLAPNLPGGTAADSERYFTEAVAATEGKAASPYVSLANATALKAQDRERWVSLMEQALAIDLDASPPDRLANDYAQRRARFLLDHVDDLFL